MQNVILYMRNIMVKIKELLNGIFNNTRYKPYESSKWKYKILKSVDRGDYIKYLHSLNEDEVKELLWDVKGNIQLGDSIWKTIITTVCLSMITFGGGVILGSYKLMNDAILNKTGGNKVSVFESGTIFGVCLICLGISVIWIYRKLQYNKARINNLIIKFAEKRGIDEI